MFKREAQDPIVNIKYLYVYFIFNLLYISPYTLLRKLMNFSNLNNFELKCFKEIFPRYCNFELCKVLVTKNINHTQIDVFFMFNELVFHSWSLEYSTCFNNEINTIDKITHYFNKAIADEIHELEDYPLPAMFPLIHGIPENIFLKLNDSDIFDFYDIFGDEVSEFINSEANIAFTNQDLYFKTVEFITHKYN